MDKLTEELCTRASVALDDGFTVEQTRAALQAAIDWLATDSANDHVMDALRPSLADMGITA